MAQSVPTDENIFAALMASSGTPPAGNPSTPQPMFQGIPESNPLGGPKFNDVTPTMHNIQCKNTVPPYATLPYEDVVRMYGVELIRTASYLLNTTPTVYYRAATLFQRYCSAVLPGLEKNLWRLHNDSNGSAAASSSSPKSLAEQYRDRLHPLQEADFQDRNRNIQSHWIGSEQWSVAMFLRRDQFSREDAFDTELKKEASFIFGPPTPYTFTPWNEAPWIRFPLDIVRFGCPSFPTTRRPRLSLVRDSTLTEWVNTECHKKSHEPLQRMEDDPRYVDSLGTPAFPAFATAPYSVDGSFIALAGACLIIAAKLEDPPTSRIRSIVNVMERLDRRRKGFQGEITAAPTEVLEALKMNIIGAEKHILTSLAYETAADPPHKYVLVILTTLLGMDSPPVPSNNNHVSAFLTTLNLSIGYCNDSGMSSLLTVLTGADGLADSYDGAAELSLRREGGDAFWDLSPTQVSPQAVACAAIHLAMTDIQSRTTTPNTADGSAETSSSSPLLLPSDWSAAFDVHPKLLGKCVAELQRVAATGPRSALVPCCQAMELAEAGSATPAVLIGTTPQSNPLSQQQPSTAANCACPLGAANFLRLYVSEMEAMERPLETNFYRRQRERGAPSYVIQQANNTAGSSSFDDDEVSRMMGFMNPTTTPQAKKASPAVDDILLQRRQRNKSASKKDQNGGGASDSDSSFLSSSISSYSSSCSRSVSPVKNNDIIPNNSIKKDVRGEEEGKGDRHKQQPSSGNSSRGHHRRSSASREERHRAREERHRARKERREQRHHHRSREDRDRRDSHRRRDRHDDDRDHRRDKVSRRGDKPREDHRRHHDSHDRRDKRPRDEDRDRHHGDRDKRSRHEEEASSRHRDRSSRHEEHRRDSDRDRHRSGDRHHRESGRRDDDYHRSRDNNNKRDHDGGHRGGDRRGRR